MNNGLSKYSLSIDWFIENDQSKSLFFYRNIIFDIDENEAVKTFYFL